MNNKSKFDAARAKINTYFISLLAMLSVLTGKAFAASENDNNTNFAKEITTDNADSWAKNTLNLATKNPKATNYDAIKLNTMDDMYKLFDQSLSIIFAELILEEIPMPGMYDDHGKYKGRNNTIGTGSTFAPINFSDWNNPNAKWWHLYSNPKTFKGRTATHEQMLQLVIGWAKHRKFTQNPKTGDFEKRETILERMFKKLQGASLRPNEFSALFCAVYNNESNINKLCGYIKSNYDKPLVCADSVLHWYMSGAANAGTKARCKFESLVYLNVNDFCGEMLNMSTCPKGRGSCINAEGGNIKIIRLNKNNYKEYSKDAEGKYQKVIYAKSVGPADIFPKINSKYFKNPLVCADATSVSLQKQYNDAIALYNKGEYQKALDKFLDIEKQGAYSCDLLNDIAVTYYGLKQYDKCIEYCRKILKTTEKDEYAKACFNAGRAYEQKGMYDKAIANYTQALNHYKNYGVSKEDKNVDYEAVYASALKRANDAKAKQAAATSNNKQK